MPKGVHQSGVRGKTRGSALYEIRSLCGVARDDALERVHAFQRAILAIPSGKVSTYGKVADAAGYPRHHRAVARLLSEAGQDDLPWHRVVGADGALKTSGTSASEQRTRLRLEGVRFKGDRVDLRVCLHQGVNSAGL